MEKPRLQREDPGPGPMPTRPLRLPIAPTPEHAPALAGLFQEAVMNIDRVVLDYSVGSLQFADTFLQRRRDEGLTVDDFAETIFVAGCYTGQVMVVNDGGKWLRGEDAKLPNGLVLMNIVVQLPNGSVTNPIGKAYRRFFYGRGDSLVQFYQVMTR